MNKKYNVSGYAHVCTDNTYHNTHICRHNSNVPHTESALIGYCCNKPYKAVYPVLWRKNQDQFS